MPLPPPVSPPAEVPVEALPPSAPSSHLPSALSSLCVQPEVFVVEDCSSAELSFLLERLQQHQLTPYLFKSVIQVSALAVSSPPLPEASQTPNSLTNTGRPALSAFCSFARRLSLCVAA